MKLANSLFAHLLLTSVLSAIVSSTGAANAESAAGAFESAQDLLVEMPVADEAAVRVEHASRSGSGGGGAPEPITLFLVGAGIVVVGALKKPRANSAADGVVTSV